MVAGDYTLSLEGVSWQLIHCGPSFAQQEMLSERVAQMRFAKA
jgi:hypothetical protein